MNQPKPKESRRRRWLLALCLGLLKLFDFGLK